MTSLFLVLKPSTFNFITAMNRMCVLSLLLLISSGEAWGQLSCDNCSFTLNGAPVSGQPGRPIVLLPQPETFDGDIVLTGPCYFTIASAGNYRLTGAISGTGPLYYNAHAANAGISLEGSGSNTYTDLTTLMAGYVICNKSGGVSVPGTIRVVAVSGGIPANLWFLADNQLGNGAVIDFSDAIIFSAIYLNGTTQTTAGIQAIGYSDGRARVENNSGSSFHPIGMTDSQVSPNLGTLNIAGGSTPCSFDGRGGYIYSGIANSPTLTVNVTGGTQIIQTPSSTIQDVTLASSSTGTLEINTGIGASNFGPDVTIKGSGTFLKTGPGQILVENLIHSGNIQVKEGNLKLVGTSKLGEGLGYTGALSIAADAVFEHGNAERIELNGDITGAGSLNSVAGGIMAIGGSAKKAFTGKMLISGNALLCGLGDISNASSIAISESGKIGGGWQNVTGGNLTVANLAFSSATSKLVVTSLSAADNNPGAVEVKAAGTSDPGPITAANGFTVDVVGSANLVSGYILKCANGLTDHLPLPTLGANTTGKNILFNWDNTGLFMTIQAGGLSCDNCTFLDPNNVPVIGTTARPAVILIAPGGLFAGDITLNGPCNFTITGDGHYRLAGVISGTGPLTYNASLSAAGVGGNSAGFSLEGSGSNTYNGFTRISGGYVICNKSGGAISVPGSIEVAGTGSSYAYLWFLADNQLGDWAVIDLSQASNILSIVYLNGTTQTVAGIQSIGNGRGIVENNGGNPFHPIGMTDSQVSPNLGTLNIAATRTAYVFGGAGHITNGNLNTEPNPSLPALTVNVSSGSQIFRDLTNTFQDVTLASSSTGVLEINAGIAGAFSNFGPRVVFKGDGVILKSGAELFTMNNSSILKSGGTIRVQNGTFRNGPGPIAYSNGNETNAGSLQVDAAIVPNSNSAPTFDLWNSPAIFDGLSGGGYVESDRRLVSNLSPSPLPSPLTMPVLTLGQNNSQGNPVFDGIIRDNHYGLLPMGAVTADQERVALKKVGSGTQALAGNNLYTGATTVSSGTLKLQGNGLLGGTLINGENSYSGNLEISNVAEGTTQAVFEHAGDKTQVFTGAITNTGDGTVLGVLLQSGSGKTIINGDATRFGGDVSITNGFLGGFGDLKNTRSVSVGANGSIGGGQEFGATLSVAGLKFLALSSKLVVAQKSLTDGSPSLLVVKTKGTDDPGPLEAANGFTVDLVGGANLASGYILKCSNGLTDHLPLPSLGENNTTKTVCFKWDAVGLWLQTSVGSITMTGTFCPKGISPANAAITIKVSYANSNEYPPTGTTGTFSLSDETVKSGDLALSRVDDATVTASFDGVNATAADIPYRVTYNDGKNCLVTLDTRINRLPALSISSGGNSACKGTPVVLQAVGNEPLIISSANANEATVTPTTTPALSATATALVIGHVNFLVTDKDGCKSDYLSVAVKDIPVMNSAAVGDALLICQGQKQPAIPLVSEGAGDAKADAYNWRLKEGGNNTYDVGLADYTTQPPTETALPEFTTLNSTTSLQSRDVVVVPYNSSTGCYGMPKDLKISVEFPPPIISVGSTDVSKLCAGLSYTDVFTGAGSWAVYKSGTAEAGLSTIANPTATSISIQAGAVSTTTVEDLVLTSALSCKNKIQITIHPKPILPDIQDMVYCSYSHVSVFSHVPDGEAEIKPTHYQWKLATNPVNSSDIGLSDYTADWTKNAITFAATSTSPGTSRKRDITITGYNQTSGCTTEPQNVTITIIPQLFLAYNFLSPICSGAETNISLASSLPGAKYKWTVNNNNVGAQNQDEPSETPAIRQTLANNGNNETVTYNVTSIAGNCTSDVSIPIEVSRSPTPATPTVTGGGEFCVNPDNNTYQTNLIPSAATDVEWAYTSYFGAQASSIAGNTKNRVKGALPAVKDNLVLTGDESAVVYYIFYPYTGGCFGTPSEPIGVTLHSAPAVEVLSATTTMCSNSAAHPTVPYVMLGLALNSGTVGAYTWTVDRTNSPDVSGFSEPSREGAIVPTNNPTAAKAGIDDPLTLADAAPAQTIDYWITPWLQGCSGKAMQAKVLVNPLPVVTPPANRRHCAGVSVEAETLEGTNGPNQFSWTGGNAVNLSDQLEFGSGNLPNYTTPTADTPPTQVTITAKNANGCLSAPTPFTISVTPKPTLAITPIAPTGSRALCTGATIGKAAAITLGITPNPAETTYTWTADFRENSGTRRSQLRIIKNNLDISLPYTQVADQTGDLSATFTANDDDNTTVTFNLTPVSNGCQGNIVKAEVNVRGKDLMSDARMDNMESDICSGNATAIKVGGEGDGNTYSWKSVDNSNNIQAVDNFGVARALSDEHEQKATVISDVLTLKDNKRGSITYFVTPSRDDCDGLIAGYNVLINPVPIISVSPDKASLCNGQKTNITLSTNLAEPESQAVVYAWQASDNTVGAQSNIGAPTAFEQQPLSNTSATEGSVTYTFTPWYIPSDKKGSCQGQPSAVTYTVNSSASARINETPEKVCLGDNLILKAVPDDAHYQWLKDGVEIADAVSHSYAAPTDKESASSYTVKITSACGSSISDPRTVGVTADAYFIGGSVAMDKTEEEVNKPVNFSYIGPDADYSWNFSDNTTAATKNASHSYAKPTTYHPVLKVIKTGQSACQKTFVLPDLKINDSNSAGFSAFPFPANSVLNVVNATDMRAISIYNLSGQLTANYAVTGRKALLPVNQLAGGIYLLLITDSDSSVRRLKIAIVH